MGTKKRMGSKLLLVSAICAITISSVSYAEEVIVGSGAFPLPGTLSVPKGKVPFPAVILVHGAGAADQDSATYALKPFRDLAEGLASKGIAVLRYNKRTLFYSYFCKVIVNCKYNTLFILYNSNVLYLILVGGDVYVVFYKV